MTINKSIMENMDDSTINIKIVESSYYWINTFGEIMAGTASNNTSSLNIGDQIKLYRGDVDKQIFAFGSLSNAIAFCIVGNVKRLSEIAYKINENIDMRITKICNIEGIKLIIQFHDGIRYLWTTDFYVTK